MSYDISGAEKKLNDLIRNSNSMPWKEAGEIVHRSIHHNFDVGGRYLKKGSPWGGPRKWKPRKKKVAWPLMKKSGDYKKSFYVQPLPNGVTIGSRGLAYNAAQNYGNIKGTLPARPALVVQKVDILNIGKLFKKHLKK